MSLRFLRASVVAVAAVVASVGPAFADSVTLDFTNVNPTANVKVKINSSTYSGAAGEMNWKVTATTDNAIPAQTNPFTVNQQVVTFCIDALHALQDPDTYTVDYQPFANDSATLLTELYAAHYADIGSNGNNAAAFQIAVWELIYDAPTTGSYTYSNGLTGGIFKDNGTTSSIINTANSWLSDFQTVGANTTGWTLYELDAGTSGQSQLYGVHTTGGGGQTGVPLPAAAPAGFALLMGLAGYRKLRRA